MGTRVVEPNLYYTEDALHLVIPTTLLELVYLSRYSMCSNNKLDTPSHLLTSRTL